MTSPETPAPPSGHAALVTAYLAGDRGALGTLYDRFAPGLYDTAAAMLSDRHEAADVVQDTFLVAAERMGQLRDPERIKPWLYAIARNEIYRRTKRRRRTTPSEALPEMAAPDDMRAEASMVSYDELATLVRDAAGGLDERDQLVLELSVRQGLQGADLAAALGVTPEQSYTLVHRMRERVERTVGALVVARQGRKDCADLREVLTGWDGTFSVLWRKRVARHVESCETCEDTRRKFAPLALVGSAPVFALPTGLRDIVMTKAGAGGGASSGYHFDGSGFPTPKSHKLWALIAAAAATIALIVGGVLLLVSPGDDVAAPPSSPLPTTAVVTAPATTLPTSTAVATTPSPTIPVTTVPVTTVAPTTSTTTTTTTTTTTVPAPPGQLSLSADGIDLGSSGNDALLTLTNTGGQPLEWSRGNASPFRIGGPSGGTLEPGDSARLVVSLDRSALGERRYREVLELGGDQPASVPLAGRVERRPVVRITEILDAGASACLPSTILVRATVTDESPLSSVKGRWSGPAGTGTFSMTKSGGEWRGIIVEPSGFGQANGGHYTATVTATDNRGNRRSDSSGFDVQYCPG